MGRWARKPVNHTSWVALVTPTDRPKSVRNRCLIELFCGVVCVVSPYAPRGAKRIGKVRFVLSLCPFDISVGVGAFVIGLSQISSFFSCYPLWVEKQWVMDLNTLRNNKRTWKWSGRSGFEKSIRTNKIKQLLSKLIKNGDCDLVFSDFRHVMENLYAWKPFFGSRFVVAEKLIFRHVHSRLHVGNLKIQDRNPLNMR